MQNTDLAGQSLPSWFFHSLGIEYLTLLSLAGLFSFIFALLLVVRGKGPLAAAGLILIVHVPLLLGCFAALQSVLASFIVISQTELTVKSSEVINSICMALIPPMFGMILMVPGYAIAALGAVIRSLFGESTEKSVQQ